MHKQLDSCNQRYTRDKSYSEKHYLTAAIKIFMFFFQPNWSPLASVAFYLR